LEFSSHLTRLWESPRFELREYNVSIYNDIEDTTNPWDQIYMHIKDLANFIRQTDGIWFIVSLGAIMNINLHCIPPFVGTKKSTSHRHIS